MNDKNKPAKASEAVTASKTTKSEKPETKEKATVKTQSPVKKKAEVKETPKAETPKRKHNVKIPTIEELFEAGVHFGHETRRWNPKMKNFIYGEKEKFHIIDLEDTQTKLKEAVDFLFEASQKGNVLMVGTKRQAGSIIRNLAQESGSYFVDKRWAGGLLSNFRMIKLSLDKLNKMEGMFEEGVSGRTKFEVSKMKKEWAKLTRLYGGIKPLTEKPVALICVDSRYEKGAIREARKVGVPVVSLVDTNDNPQNVDYPIPANDDGLKSIKLLLGVLAEAVKQGNQGKGVKHNLKDYTDFGVDIKKGVDSSGDLDSVEVETAIDVETKVRKRNISKIKKIKKIVKPIKKIESKTKKKVGQTSGGILEALQKAKESKRKQAK